MERKRILLFLKVVLIKNKKFSKHIIIMFRFFCRNLSYLRTQVIVYQVVFSYFFDTIRKNMEETMKFKRLKDLREDHDKYQKDIAELLGISQQYYSEYESGKRTIPIQHLITLAKYYNTSIDYIVGLINEIDKKHIS